MKKTVFKNWVSYTLVTINILIVMLMSADCESLSLYITKDIVCLMVFLMNAYLLKKYAKKDCFE